MVDVVLWCEEKIAKYISRFTVTFFELVENMGDTMYLKKKNSLTSFQLLLTIDLFITKIHDAYSSTIFKSCYMNNLCKCIRNRFFMVAMYFSFFIYLTIILLTIKIHQKKSLNSLAYGYLKWNAVITHSNQIQQSKEKIQNSSRWNKNKK